MNSGVVVITKPMFPGTKLITLGVHDMILLTNTHHTLVGLEGYGLSIVGERAIPGTGGE
jgi:3,4-dihydroxy 2-butanone 4-phosphate synthase/GTP cyclohydrolase II